MAPVKGQSWNGSYRPAKTASSPCAGRDLIRSSQSIFAEHTRLDILIPGEYLLP